MDGGEDGGGDHEGWLDVVEAKLGLLLERTLKGSAPCAAPTGRAEVGAANSHNFKLEKFIWVWCVRQRCSSEVLGGNGLGWSGNMYVSIAAIFLFLLGMHLADLNQYSFCRNQLEFGANI